jgi:plasmid stability protein
VRLKEMAKAKSKYKTFMLRKLPRELHRLIRIEAAKRELSMEEAIYELLTEKLMEGKANGQK